MDHWFKIRNSNAFSGWCCCEDPWKESDSMVLREVRPNYTSDDKENKRAFL